MMYMCYVYVLYPHVIGWMLDAMTCRSKKQSDPLYTTMYYTVTTIPVTTNNPLCTLRCTLDSTVLLCMYALSTVSTLSHLAMPLHFPLRPHPTFLLQILFLLTSVHHAFFHFSSVQVHLRHWNESEDLTESSPSTFSSQGKKNFLLRPLSSGNVRGSFLLPQERPARPSRLRGSSP